MTNKHPEAGLTENKYVIADDENGSTRHALLHDHDVLGRTNVTREYAIHMGDLTEEELMHEKKLRRKIDAMIMPLVMLVSRQLIAM
jgi:hypothetical protein